MFEIFYRLYNKHITKRLYFWYKFLSNSNKKKIERIKKKNIIGCFFHEAKAKYIILVYFFKGLFYPETEPILLIFIFHRFVQPYTQYEIPQSKKKMKLFLFSDRFVLSVLYLKKWNRMVNVLFLSISNPC